MRDVEGSDPRWSFYLSALKASTALMSTAMRWSQNFVSPNSSRGHQWTDAMQLTASDAERVAEGTASCRDADSGRDWRAASTLLRWDVGVNIVLAVTGRLLGWRDGRALATAPGDTDDDDEAGPGIPDGAREAFELDCPWLGCWTRFFSSVPSADQRSAAHIRKVVSIRLYEERRQARLDRRRRCEFRTHSRSSSMPDWAT